MAELREMVEGIRERGSRMCPDAVKFVQIKAHVDARGIEHADQLAKEGVEERVGGGGEGGDGGGG